VYVVSSSSPAVANGVADGASGILTVTGGSTKGTAAITVLDVASGDKATVTVTNGTAGGGGSDALLVSPNPISVAPGIASTAAVIGGSGVYVATSANPLIATASVGGGVLTVTGGGVQGSTYVTVTDTLGAVYVVTVDNGQAPATLIISPSIVYTISDVSVSAVISGGSGGGNYQVSAVNAAIVKSAEIQGAVVTFTGGDFAGAINAVVYDVVANRSATVLVINNSPNALTATPNSITIVTGATSASSNVSGGTGPYTITSPPNSEIATASIVGSQVTLTRVSAGHTSVTVTDAVTGRAVVVGVDVQ
jgi:hypothetical protein